MSLTILYLAEDDEWPDYAREFPRALAEQGVDGRLVREADPKDVDYIVYAPRKGIEIDFTLYPNARAVMSLWAGVERVLGNKTLTQRLARMADSGLREGMVEWVTGHVLRHHLGMDQHILGQDGVWRPLSVAPLARSRTVGFLGLGALGAACAQAAATLNFRVAGWSRRPRDVAGVECFSGDDGLRALLSQTDILVLLLPKTVDTENILNAETLAMLPKGAFIINPGRGPLIDDDALLAALDAGHIAHATLDVFRQEPLPPDHPYWAHPRVTVTPHIASSTRADTAADFVVTNIARVEQGLPMLAEVDRAAGY